MDTQDDFERRLEDFVRTFARGFRELFSGEGTSQRSSRDKFTQLQPEPMQTTRDAREFDRGFVPKGDKEEGVGFGQQEIDLDAFAEVISDEIRNDREFRARHFEITRRAIADSTNDLLRIDDLERRLEFGRETISDVNI